MGKQMYSKNLRVSDSMTNKTIAKMDDISPAFVYADFKIASIKHATKVKYILPRTLIPTPL